MWFPPEFGGNQKKWNSRRGVADEASRITRRRSARDTWHPTRSLAEVARAHGLNANLVSKWRRDQERAAASASEPAELFLPIEMASPPMPEPIGSSGDFYRDRTHS
ncbi:transposase [Cupriavidus sp. BIC8F]|uniref:transposase n=1 Tax=Cupriavidus sp. BIC8F TaxID=3079014 RepID=UPI003966DA07